MDEYRVGLAALWNAERIFIAALDRGLLNEDGVRHIFGQALQGTLTRRHLK